MKKFKVTVTEKYSQDVLVYAESVEAAYELVGGMEINMDGEDYVDDSFDMGPIKEVPLED